MMVYCHAPILGIALLCICLSVHPSSAGPFVVQLGPLIPREPMDLQTLNLAWRLLKVTIIF